MEDALWVDVVRWFAGIGGMLAAIMIAARVSDRITGFGFVLFSVVSVAWIVGGLAEDDPALMWQNVVLLGVNLLGVWRWLVRPFVVGPGIGATATATARTPLVRSLFRRYDR